MNGHKWAIHGTCESGGGFWLLLQEDSLEAEEHLACLRNHRNFRGCCVQNRLWIDFCFQLRHAKILEVITKEQVKQLKINNFACQRTEVTRQRVPLKFGDTGKYRDHSQDLLTWSSSCKSHKLIGTLKWCFDKLKEAEYGLLVAEGNPQPFLTFSFRSPPDSHRKWLGNIPLRLWLREGRDNSSEIPPEGS